MALRRFQIVILSFALGISAATFVFGYLLKVRYESVTVTPTPVFIEQVEVVKVFFSNTKEDPDTLYCDRTYPVERQVVLRGNHPAGRLGELFYLTIVELLKGPTEEEKMNESFSSINMGVEVKMITVENGIATVDFNERLSEGVAGSCRVQAIRSQISETMKQFPDVQEVVISVDGESEEILEP